MARRPGSTRRTKDEAAQATEDQVATPEVVDTETQTEGTENEAPETSEENEVTVTEPEVEQTEAPQADEAEATQPAAAPEGEAQGEAKADEAPAEKSAKELEADFRQACEDGVELADDATGSVPEVGLDKVLTAYRDLPSTTSKSAVKNWLGEEMRNALIAGQINRARALSDINAKVQDASTRRSAAAPAKPSKSPTEVYLDTCLTLEVAKQFVARPKDEELEDNWQEQFNQRFSDLLADGGPVAQYLAWLNTPDGEERGDEPEVDVIVKNAAKLAQGKAVGGRKSSGTRKSGGGSSSGVRRNVGAHIDEFLAQADPNAEYTVAEVANFNSTEYGDDHPSPGAVAARLFPGGGKASTIQGFEQVPGSEPKKIRKI